MKKKLYAILVVLSSLLYLAPNTQAQVTYDKLWITDGTVNSLAQSAGTLYVGGTFTYVGPNTSFAAPISSTTGSVLGNIKVSGTVNTVVADGSGGWFIGGSFANVNGVTRSNLAHILSDYSLDPAWSPSVSGAVNTLALDNGILYVGGLFTSLAGTTRNRIGALNASDGTLISWNPNSSSTVRRIIVSGSTVYVAGAFATIGGQIRNRLAALDASTGLATSWNPNADNTVNTMELSGATLYVGGDFLNVGGQARNRIAAISTSTGTATTWNPNASASVTTMALSGSNLYVGGAFTSIGGQNRNRIAAINTTNGNASIWDPNANAQVDVIGIQNSTIYVGGQFTTIGGSSRSRIAAFDLSAGTLNSWVSNASSGTVSSLAFSGTTVFAGGSFSSIGGVFRTNLAAFDVHTGQATSWAPNPDGNVQTIEISNTNIYIGGAFVNAGGQARNRIAAIDASTGLATSWNPNAGNTVNAIKVSGSTVYVGGTFTTIGGQTRNRIAALNASDGLATSWNPNANGTVVSLLISGNTIYVGGSGFSTIGGQTRNRLAAIDASSGLAMAFNPNASAQVNAMILSGGTLYVAGRFTTIGGASRTGLAALEPSTGTASSWNANFGGDVISIALAGDVIYASGVFTTVGGQTRNRIASVSLSDGAVTTWNPNSGGNTNAILTRDNVLFTGGAFTTINGIRAGGLADIIIPSSCPSLSKPTVTAGGPTTFCSGGSVTLTAPAGLKYSWNTGAENQSITVTTAGSYFVRTVELASNCFSEASIPVTVTVNAVPSAPAITGTSSVCLGSSRTLTATAGFTNYQWSSNNGSTWTTENSGNTISVSPTGATSYVVRGSNAFGCYSLASSAFALTVDPVPNTPSISGNTIVCPSATTTLTATAGLASYEWSSDGGTTWTPTAGNTLAASTSGVTNYVVRGISAVGCTSATSTAHTLRTLALSSTLSTITCSDMPFSYVPTTDSPGATITWTRAFVSGILNFPVNSPQSGAINESLSNNTSGNVTVIYQITLSAGGCSSTTQNVSVVVRPRATLNSGFIDSKCPGELISYTPSSATPGCTITWTRAAVGGISNPAITTPQTGSINETLNSVLSTFIPVLYTFRITTPEGCISTQDVGVTLKPVPFINSSTATLTQCAGTATTYTITSTEGSASLSWTRAAVPGIQNPANNFGFSNINEVLVNTTNDDIPVTYNLSSTFNGCSDSKTLTVIVKPSSAVSQTTTSGITTLTANGTGPYSWSTGASTKSIDIAASGLYSVAIGSCPASSSFIRHYSPAASPSLSPSYDACGNEQVLNTGLTEGNITTIAGQAGTSGQAVGDGTSARFNMPSGVAMGHDGSYYVADKANHCIKRIDRTTFAVSVYAGTSGTSGNFYGSRLSARFNNPTDVVADSKGNLYIADAGNRVIKQIDVAGNVSNYAGSSAVGNLNGNGSSASFTNPQSIAITNNDIIIVADVGSRRIRSITTNRVVETIVSTELPTDIVSVAMNPAASNEIFVTCTDHRIRKVTFAGVVSVYAGSGSAGSADGNLTAASFNGPTSIVASRDSILYVTDYNNGKIRRIAPSGVSTIAGAGSTGNTDGSLTTATMTTPADLLITDDGKLLVVQENHVVRLITPMPTVTWTGGLSGLSPTAIASGTYIATVRNLHGNTTSTTTNVTVGLPATPTLSVSSGEQCVGNVVAVNNTATCPTCTYAWSNGSNGATTTIVAGVNNLSVTATKTSNNCNSLAGTATITGLASGTWLGASDDWSSSANWCGGVPSSGANISIRTGSMSAPRIASGSVSVNNISLTGGAVLNMASSTWLNVTGDITGSGTINGGCNGGIQLSGSGQQQVIAVPMSLNQLTINNASGAKINGLVTVCGALNLNNGILNTADGTLILAPTAANITETATSRVVGNITARGRVVGTGTLSMLGVQLASGADDLDTVFVQRRAEVSSYLSRNGIGATWSIRAHRQPSSGRQVTLHWPAAMQNGKAFSGMQVWRRPDNSTQWQKVGIVQNRTAVSAAPFITVNTTGFSDWTVSDEANPLPVTWQLFTARRQTADLVQLTWTTAQEFQNAGFVVERSLDNFDFDSLTWVNGNGTTASASTYEYQDLFAGRAYYRLTQVDQDGKRTSSNSILVSNTQEGAVSLHPNPTSGKVTFTGLEATAEVSITTAAGKLIKSTRLPQDGQLDISQFAPGVYIFQVGDQRLRVVKQ